MRTAYLCVTIVFLRLSSSIICSDLFERNSLAVKLLRLGRWKNATVKVFERLLQFIEKNKCNWKYREACNVKCEQGKIHYRDNCCKCVCKKNYAVINRTLCAKAIWTRWSAWSECIASDWGGLQTRERDCKAGTTVTAGSCSGRGSMSRTCRNVVKSYRIRKNIRDLTDFEIHDLVQAMTKFKKDSSKNGYRNIISWHGWPGRCPWYHAIHKDDHCSWHHHPMFLPWHRLITIQLEEGLSRFLHNKTMGIPFWDWTEDWKDIPFLLREPKLYDPVLKRIVTNPFYSTYIRSIQGTPLYNQRHPWYEGLLMNRYLLKGTIRALLSHNHYTFAEQLSSNPHDQIHNCFCISFVRLYGKLRCMYGMPSVKYAAWDPAFLFHHSAIDRLFVMRRILEDEAGVSDWTSSRVSGQYVLGLRTFHAVRDDVTKSFDWPMSPFCNTSMNPLSLTNGKGRWTTHKSYYETQLFGYKYTDFNLGHGYSWEDLKRDYKRVVLDSTFWNDEYFDTKIGLLHEANAKGLAKVMGCALIYSNPKLNVSISWN